MFKLALLVVASCVFGGAVAVREYVLPRLPYVYDGLEPYMDEATVRVHYHGHHQAYCDKLNAAYTRLDELGHKSLARAPVEQLLRELETVPEELRTTIRNSGGGFVNHNIFWESMDLHGGEPSDEVRAAIVKSFGSFEKFKEEFSTAAAQVFGSGWAWLLWDTEAELLRITTTKDQDSPVTLTQVPLLNLDVWEHAYYLKYKNKRQDFIDSWWNIVNWRHVNDALMLAIYGEQEL